MAHADSPRSLVGADMDGDGDVDVLASSQLADRIVWVENTCTVYPAPTPRPTRLCNEIVFSETHVVDPSLDSPTGVFAFDVDGDGDTDVLAASAWAATVAWYEAVEEGYERHDISDDAYLSIGIVALDFDQVKCMNH